MCCFHKIDAELDRTERHAVDVHDVQRCTGRRRVCNDLLNAGDAGIAYVNENRCLSVGRKPKKLEYFFAGCSRLITHGQTDTECAGFELGLQQRLHFFDLGCIQRVIHR